MRFEVAKPVGLSGAYLMGLAFAFGWTPCIEPILAAILAIAASEQTVAKGAAMLAIYSLGLGVPFIVAALAFRRAIGAFGWIKRHYVWVMRTGGGMLQLPCRDPRYWPPRDT